MFPLQALTKGYENSEQSLEKKALLPFLAKCLRSEGTKIESRDYLAGYAVSDVYEKDDFL